MTTDHFSEIATLVSIANQIPDLTLVSVGMTFVLIARGIDLSVGSVLALSSAIFGVLIVDRELPLIVAGATAIIAAATCGLINGLISIKARIPSFIVTLGMLEVARGLTKLVTKSETKYIGTIIESISDPIPYLLISPAFVFALFTVFAGQFLLSRMAFGRYFIAIGTNENAVRLSGINVAPYQIATFVLCGILCGIAGVIHAAKLSTADPNAAVGIELSAIAACVIGGTSLMGGRGNVLSTFLGVLIIATLQTGLAQLGASDPIKQVITGSVIIAAVLTDAIKQRWNKSKA
ncbi:MAG: ABC transporter permease [Rubripirellula sp.]|nr:ABC transporter permease [Rubripirellula sp.]